MGHQETPARETFHPTWLSVKVAKKRGESLDTGKARSAKGTRTFCLRHPQEGEGEDQEEEELTPQTMTTTMIEDIVTSAEKRARRCRDCPVSRCVELLIVVLTLDSYLSLCRLVLAY